MFKIIFLVQLVAWVSCRTSEKEVTAAFVDGEHPPIRIESDGETQEVPGFMWSPSQRKATAGYQFLVAEYASLSGQMNKASDSYKNAYSLDPNPYLAAKLIRSHASTGKLDDALPEAKKMVLLYPKSSELRLLYGQLLARKGIYYNAVKELEKSIEIGPPSELAYNELISLHVNAGLNSRALLVVEEYIQAFSNSAEAWAKAAQLHYNMGNHKKVLEPARRAYELQSLNPEYALLYAIASELNGDRKKAVSLYEQLYRMDPSNEELIGRMITLYKNLGDLEDALGLLNELSSLAETPNPGVNIQKAFLLWELKRFQEASVILEELARQFPDSDRLQYMKGLGYERTDRMKEATEAYRKIAESSAFYTEARFRLLVTLKTLGQNREAESVFDNILNKENITWEFFVIGSGVKADLGKNQEASAILKQGFQKFPDQPRLLFLAGVYAEKAEDMEGAIDIMRQVIKADPSYSAAYNFLGYLFAESGTHLDEAETLIKKALELKPNDGYYLDSLGWLYYQKGNFAEAKKYLEQALALLPEEGVVLEHLSDVYLKLGDQNRAFQYLEKAKNGHLEDRDKKRVLDKYEAMKKSKAIQ